MTNEPVYQFADSLSTLESTLRDNGRPIALLIGAGGGCSLRPNGIALIPAIAELTIKVRDDLTSFSTELATLEQTLSEDGVKGATVEDWLSRLRTLMLIVGETEVRGLNQKKVVALEEAIVVSIAKLVTQDLPDDAGGYRAVAEWGAGFDRTRPLEIFTLSYDLLMEQAFERARVSYFDGFLGSHQPFLDLRAMEEDALPTRWTRLWKMHGSVNWKLNDGVAYRTADWQQGNFLGALIHPSHMKYDQSRRMPYLAMQDRLRAFMRQPGATLVTIGYSFGDQHINELIEEGLRVNPGSVCFGLLFEDRAKFKGAVDVAMRMHSLRLYARDGAVLKGKPGTWAPPPEGEEHKNLGDFNKFGDLLTSLTVEA